MERLAVVWYVAAFSLVSKTAGQTELPTSAPTFAPTFDNENGTDIGGGNPERGSSSIGQLLSTAFLPAIVVTIAYIAMKAFLVYYFDEERLDANRHRMGMNTEIYLITKKPHLSNDEIDKYTQSFTFAPDHEYVIESQSMGAIDPDETYECPICIDTFKEGDETRRLPCGHYFHADCVDLWFDRSIECPLCKQDVHKAHDTRHKKGSKELNKKDSAKIVRRPSGGAIRSGFARMMSSLSMSEKNSSSSTSLVQSNPIDNDIESNSSNSSNPVEEDSQQEDDQVTSSSRMEQDGEEGVESEREEDTVKDKIDSDQVTVTIDNSTINLDEREEGGGNDESNESIHGP